LARVLNVVLFGLALILCIGLAAMAVGGVLSLIEPRHFDRMAQAGLLVGGLSRQDFITGLFFGAVATSAALALTLLMRRVLRTVARGEPFHPDNPRNLRMIAVSLAVVSGCGLAADLLVRTGANDRPDIDLSSWLSVLIVLVLAEVFREGARLRADAELTV
jgi:hypothetical protein